MPYIKPELRMPLDGAIQVLARTINTLAKEDQDRAGLLNYSCTKLALQVIPDRRYWCIALISGVFHNIADEFYRRYAAPYEEEQIKKNGDVF